MVKKVNKKVEIDNTTDLVGWAQGNIQVGTPSMGLLPAKNYPFSILEENHLIEIPRSGTYHDLDPLFFAKEDGEFNLFDGKSKVMYLPAISKVLFAVSKYPDLKANQIFVPITLKFKRNTVEIVGHVIEMIPPDALVNKEGESS
jgi:hypothetical protein